MNFRQAEAWLDQLQLFKIKLGLAATAGLLAELGHPQDRFGIIHIAGTNGKGSVGATISALLSTASHRVGFFSSPHLCTVRERFRINGACIGEADFARLIGRVAEVCRGRALPTYFECTTLVALLWFAEQQVEVAILETGLGGRLDATNVVTPRMTVITAISRDHEHYLGTTIEEIAAEKAGIIKPGIPVVHAGNDPVASEVIAARCREMRSPLFLHGRDFAATDTTGRSFAYRPLAGEVRADLPLPLPGAHQAVNAALALAALELLAERFPLSDQTLRAGLGQVRWPGRLERINAVCMGKPLRFLLDGAHNEAGVHTLIQALRQGFPRGRLVLIWANMADKNMGSALPELIGLAAAVVLTRAETQRSAAPEELLARLSPEARSLACCAATPELALETACRSAGPDDLICVAGSLYLVGRIRFLLMGACC